MAWDDELDRLVTSVHDALARVVTPGTVVDFCGFRRLQAEVRAADVVSQLPAAEGILPPDNPTPAHPVLRVVDLCGFAPPRRVDAANNEASDARRSPNLA
jgi:hypothetical protein